MPPIPTSPTTRLGRLIAIAALALAACSGNDDGTATPATTPAEPTTTTTTTTAPTPTPIDVATVPDEITVEYVQAVMDELDRRIGDLFRMYVEAEGPTQETQDLLVALYVEPELTPLREELGQIAAERFDVLDQPVGDPSTSIGVVLDASATCIFAEVTRDLDAVFIGDRGENVYRSWIGLVPKPISLEADRLNPTAWSISLDGSSNEGERPPAPCA
jgi:hypothetical protein